MVELWRELIDLHDRVKAALGGSPTDAEIYAAIMAEVRPVKSAGSAKRLANRSRSASQTEPQRRRKPSKHGKPDQRLSLVPASIASFGATRRVNFSNRHSKSPARAIAVRHGAGTLARL